MRCAGMTVGLAVTLAFFGLTDLAVCQSMAKKKPVNLLRLPSARVELAPAADKDALPALTDEDPATIAVFKAAKNAPVDIVYGFEGATVTPENLVVRQPEKPAPLRIELLISSADKPESFRSLYATALKPIEKPQEFRLPRASARWIMLRWTPLGAAAQVAVADVSIIGQPTGLASIYPFTRSADQAFETIARLKQFNRGRTELAPDEAALFAEAKYGNLGKFSFAEAALIASGVVESAKRQAYLKQLDGIEAEAKKAVAGAGAPLEKGEALLKFLHAGPMKNKYAAKQTTLSGILDTGTFNCVSSAVMYNVIGRRLGLDLRAIEVPDHAFAILYDGDKHADVETTNKLGFNPERDARVIQEFEKETGFRYIPDRHRDQRREIGELGLLAIIYSNRSNEADKEKNHGEAALTAFGALALDPEFPGGVQNARASFANWSSAAIKAGRFTEAMAVLDVGLELEPKDSTLAGNRKACWQDWIKATYAAEGEEKARAVALQLLKDNPSSAALREIARSHVVRHMNERAKAGKFEEALDFIQRNQELVAKPADLRQVIWQDWLKATFDKQGEEKGRALALRLLKENPTDTGLRAVTRGQVIGGLNGLKSAGKFEEGIAYVGRNKELVKDDAEARSMAAGLYDAWARTYWRKNWDRAIAIYEKGLADCPKDRLLETNLKYCQAQKK